MITPSLSLRSCHHTWRTMRRRSPVTSLLLLVSTRYDECRHVPLRQGRSASSSSMEPIEDSPLYDSLVPEYNDQEYATTYHAPVMWRECIEALLGCRRTTGTTATPPQPGLIFVDGTLGGGGHSEALLQRLEPGDLLLGCDVDREALLTASRRLVKYLPRWKGTRSEDDDDNTTAATAATSADEQVREQLPIFLPVKSNFGNLIQALNQTLHPQTQMPINQVDGILLDLGVSSHQINTPGRGFAFMQDGPLDMRLDGTGPLTAADICNEFDPSEIQRILKMYGDEPRAKQIAHAIAERRPLHTTQDLVDAVTAVTPQFAKKGRRMGRTATLARVFQSFRIVVNQEEDMLQKALTEMAPKLLKPGGRLVVLSYHSLEDRAVKRVMRDGTVSEPAPRSRDMYGNDIGAPLPFRILIRKQKASPEEVERNPRARSATLRVAEKI